MSELISVIVPVYNVQDYLRECVDSICAQTYRNIEIILVDDGSTDESGMICDEYASKNERIRVIHKENGGQSSARNRGIDVAEGRWLTFVDSDDLVAPDMVEILHAAIGTADISMCNRQKFADSPEMSGNVADVVRYSGLDFLNFIYDAPRYIAIWGKLYCRELFHDFRFQEGIIYEDEDALPQLIYASREIAYVPVEKYFYRVRPNSTMTAGFSKKRMDIIGVCKHRIELLEQWGLEELRQKAVKDYYNHLKRLEKQTHVSGFENEHAIVLGELEQWKKYSVRFSLYERIRQKLGM